MCARCNVTADQCHSHKQRPRRRCLANRFQNPTSRHTLPGSAAATPRPRRKGRREGKKEKKEAIRKARQRTRQGGRGGGQRKQIERGEEDDDENEDGMRKPRRTRRRRINTNDFSVSKCRRWSLEILRARWAPPLAFSTGNVPSKRPGNMSIGRLGARKWRTRKFRPMSPLKLGRSECHGYFFPI